MFSASHDDSNSQSRGDLHEKKKKKKGEVLVHLAFVRNEEFQQFRPAGSERTKEWMSLFSSFRPGLGAPLCSVQTPIVAVSLSSLGPCAAACTLLLETRHSIPAPPPVFTSHLCAVFIDLLSFFLDSFLEETLMNQILEEREK